MTSTVRRTFSSLRVRNYRLFFVGQCISLCGTWIQRVAQAWLVLELTGSGTAVGLVTALQFVPLLVLAPIGGVIADRISKRRLLVLTQGLASLSAASLGAVVLSGVVELWMVYVLAFILGIAGSIDNPTRQTFVLEMVGRGQLTNALALNSSLVNAARVVGPAIAGLLIVTVGIGWCFAINAASYLAVIAALYMMRADELESTPIQPRRPGQLREGFRYVRSTPAVLTPILMMAVAGTFAYEYQVVLPLMARFTFNGDAQTFTTMTSAMGVGAVAGGLYTASRQNRPAITLARIAAVFGMVQVLAGLAPNLVVALVALVALGAMGVSFIALGNSTLQLTAAPEMRGRVMGLWAVAFLGTTPFGAPIMGWIGEQIGPRWALGFGGVAVLLSAVVGWRGLAMVDRAARSDEPGR
ncbi:MAG TPA: MFS transporter [Acidimicrobiia bacterium]|nr:MFS transporter [Acidimicrobiia bacterium]